MAGLELSDFGATGWLCEVLGDDFGGLGECEGDADGFAARAAVPPQFAGIFDTVIGAVRQALAATLHDLFLYAMAAALLALVASVFLKDVPIRGRTTGRATGTETGEAIPSFGG